MKLKNLILFSLLVVSSKMMAQSSMNTSLFEEVKQVLSKSVNDKAKWALAQKPITITAYNSARSAGGKHDFYSEGDYWWPNPKHPDSPYIQKDGMTNPDNFVEHRRVMIRLSEIVGSLASAYLLNSDQVYADKIIEHCKAWFIDTTTRMNPNLLYAQAIKGRYTGRGIGIIDAVHLMEVVQALIQVEKKSSNKYLHEIIEIRKWFQAFLAWLTTHQYGKDEMNAANNHGTCWVMQVAAFARFTGNKEIQNFCKERYKTVLLPRQMAEDGSFPLELKRTKPYGYSIFNLDAMATICQILSTSDDNLWNYETAAGQSIYKGIGFLFPYIKDKAKWPFSQDVMYWNNWPVAQPFLVFGAMAKQQKDWLNVWKKLDHQPSIEEVIRNLPVRNPLIWY